MRRKGNKKAEGDIELTSRATMRMILSVTVMLGNIR